MFLFKKKVQEKQKYAKWKAADIIKAFKEGRTPVPGPPGGDPNLKTHPENSTPQFQPQPQQPQQPNHPPQQPYNQPPQQPKPAPRHVATAPVAAPVAAPRHNYNIAQQHHNDDDDEYQPSYDPLMIAEVQKMCKYAISALNYEDVTTAVDNLEKALRMLNSAKKS